MFRKIHKTVSIVILVIFLVTSVKSPAYAQVTEDLMPRLPAPGAMVHLSPQFASASLQGITIHPDNALKFDFLIHKGGQVLASGQKTEEYRKLVKYFLASLTIPDEDQWVNLSPYEKDRIIKDDFGKTGMGRDLLAEDYLLKQITSSLIYPEDGLGKKFWDKVYERAWKEYGTSNVPVNTFNKVWIVPDQAFVYESGNSAYILKSHLKVMLEEDYLSLKKHEGAALMPSSNNAHAIGSQVIRDIILPELEHEVNEGRNFANLRQMFSGMILATWYKKALKDSLLGMIYADKAKVKGVDQDPQTIKRIYQQYLKAFKKGVFNYIREDVNKYTKESIPRKYFSGGWEGLKEAEFVSPQTDFSQSVGKVFIADKASISLIPNVDTALLALENSLDNASVTLEQMNRTLDDQTVRMTTDKGRLDSTEAMPSILEMNNRKLHPVVYDIGIGWVEKEGPATVNELADLLPNARIIGIDNQVPTYQVSVDGGTALFNETGKLLYWEKGKQVEMESSIDVETRLYLGKLFTLIKDKVGAGQKYYEGKIEKFGGVNVVYDPITEHKKANLDFVSADLFNLRSAAGELSKHKADIVRIANVIFPHYTADAIIPALKQLFPFVNDGGIVMIGKSNPASFRGEDYLVYQRTPEGFRLEQYAFGMNFETLGFGTSLGGFYSPAGKMVDELFQLIQGHVDKGEWGSMLEFRSRYERAYGKDAQKMAPYAKSLTVRMMGILAGSLKNDEKISATATGPLVFIDVGSVNRSQSPLAVKMKGLFQEYFFDSGIPRSVDAAMSAEELMNTARHLIRFFNLKYSRDNRLPYFYLSNDKEKIIDTWIESQIPSLSSDEFPKLRTFVSQYAGNTDGVDLLLAALDKFHPVSSAVSDKAMTAKTQTIIVASSDLNLSRMIVSDLGRPDVRFVNVKSLPEIERAINEGVSLLIVDTRYGNIPPGIAKGKTPVFALSLGLENMNAWRMKNVSIFDLPYASKEFVGKAREILAKDAAMTARMAHERVVTLEGNFRKPAREMGPVIKEILYNLDMETVVEDGESDENFLIGLGIKPDIETTQHILLWKFNVSRPDSESDLIFKAILWQFFRTIKMKSFHLGQDIYLTVNRKDKEEIMQKLRIFKAWLSRTVIDEMITTLLANIETNRGGNEITKHQWIVLLKGGFKGNPNSSWNENQDDEKEARKYLLDKDFPDVWFQDADGNVAVNKDRADALRLWLEKKKKDISRFDQAQLADNKGGIDLNSANLDLQIKRDGRGVPLPLIQQDMLQLSRIQGFEPEIIEIKPAVNLPILNELQQELHPS